MCERDVMILRGVMKGMRRGALAGGTLSLATGAAIAAGPVTAVALPAVILVNAGVISQWAAAGSIVGGVAGGLQAWHKHHQVSQEFNRIFGRVTAVA